VDFVAAVRPGNQRGTSFHSGGCGGSRGRGGRGTARGSDAAHEPDASKEAKAGRWCVFQALEIQRCFYCLHPSLKLAGKRRRQWQLNTVSPGEPMHLSDELFVRLFLVDTGTSYNIFCHLKGPRLQVIPCWGGKQLPMQLSGHRFTWTFLLAKVEFPILGADFLKHFNLMVDLLASQLLDTDTLKHFAAGQPVSDTSTQKWGSLFSAVKSMPPLFRGVFNKFQDVANASGSLPPAKHKTVHHIHTTRPPAMAHFHCLDAATLTAAKAAFSKLEKEGVIWRSASNWSTPMHMVMKPDRTWRPCGLIIATSVWLQHKTYPLPNIQDLSSRLSS
jgi:hypothetical protein